MGQETDLRDRFHERTQCLPYRNVQILQLPWRGADPMGSPFGGGVRRAEGVPLTLVYMELMHVTVGCVHRLNPHSR